MAKTEKLMHEDGTVIYPATVTDAVVNPTNRKPLTQELEELGKNGVVEVTHGTAPSKENTKVYVDLDAEDGLEICPEAPNDGRMYHRGSKAWYEAVGAKTPEGGEIFNTYSGQFRNVAKSLSSARGYANKALGEASAVDGYENTIDGQGSYGCGRRNETKNNWSFVCGKSNITTNPCESAKGLFNKSNNGTLDSIGLGSSSLKKNVIETMLNGKHYILGVGGYDGTNAVDANSQGVVAQDIATVINNGGTLRPLYEEAGAKWNPKTGYYELNGLTDITEGQMKRIYVRTNNVLNHNDLSGSFAYMTFRTNITKQKSTFGLGNTYNIYWSFCASSAEVICFLGDVDKDYAVVGGEANAAFRNCFSLTKIQKLDVSKVTNFSIAFDGCPALKNVRLQYLKTNVSFKDSPLLDISEDVENGSLAFIVHNALGEKPITITLAKVLEGKIPQSILTEAGTKQITIAFA